MKTFAFTAAAGAALAAAVLGPAGAAAAFPGDGSAADTVSSLQSQGYNVEVNGVTNGVPLSRCTATGQHPSNLDPSATLDQKRQTLVTVDVSCPHS